MLIRTVEKVIILLFRSGLEYENVIMDSSQLPGATNSASSSSYVPQSASPASSATSLNESMSKRTPLTASPTSSPSLQSHLTSSVVSQRSNESEEPSLQSLDNIHNSSSIHNHSKTPESPSVSTSGSTRVTGNLNGHMPNESSKRRRFTSSPVRPWRSPSPAGGDIHPSAGRPPGLSPVNAASVPASPASSSSNSPSNASNLLRHISVICETPPIVKPQVVPSYHHAHHPPAHHYHHHPLVDPYTAYFKDYHIYKNGGNLNVSSTPTAPVSGPHHHHHHPHHPHHPWGTYN